MAGAQIIPPAPLQIGLDVFESSPVVVGVHAGYVTELICRTHIVIAAIGQTARSLLEALAIIGVVFGCELVGSIRDGASSPPSADCTGNAADDRSDRTACRADCGSGYYA